MWDYPRVAGYGTKGTVHNGVVAAYRTTSRAVVDVYRTNGSKAAGISRTLHPAPFDTDKKNSVQKMQPWKYTA